jgi:hypothetical protein
VFVVTVTDPAGQTSDDIGGYDYDHPLYGSISSDPFVIYIAEQNDLPYVLESPMFYAPENYTGAVKPNPDMTGLDGRVEGIDDEGDDITYSLSGTGAGTYFSIGETTGLVTVISPVDYEGPEAGFFDLQVIMSDGVSTMTSYTDMIIWITDVEPESGPTFQIGDQIEDQTVLSGVRWIFHVPDEDRLPTEIDAFENEAAIQYNATLSGGAPLPDWLHFNNANLDQGTFWYRPGVGTAPTADTTLTIELTATNMVGGVATGSLTQTFDITFDMFPYISSLDFDLLNAVESLDRDDAEYWLPAEDGDSIVVQDVMVAAGEDAEIAGDAELSEAVTMIEEEQPIIALLDNDNQATSEEMQRNNEEKAGKQTA